MGGGSKKMMKDEGEGGVLQKIIYDYDKGGVYILLFS